MHFFKVKPLLLVLCISSAFLVTFVTWKVCFVQERLIDEKKGLISKQELYTDPRRRPAHSFFQLPNPDINHTNTANNAPLGLTDRSMKECSPKKNIIFFKMHKCSSSTVQNILFRFGERHRLNFVLPPQYNLLGTTFFEREFMIEFPVKEYNIFCHHTRFSAQAISDVMPQDAVYTTILRDPVKVYESTFTYMFQKGGKSIGLSKSSALENFLQNPKGYYMKDGHSDSRLKNPMLYDLGLEDSDQFKASSIKGMIDELANRFDLVMLTEYFDESLILLRHLMCWEMDDVVYFVQNERDQSSVKPLSSVLAKKIRAWNSGDVELYDRFNYTFWQQVEAFGTERMRGEVAQLRRRNRHFVQRCVDSVINDDEKVWHPPGIKIHSFKLKKSARRDEMCLRMTMTELPYTDKLRWSQLLRYNMQ